MIRVTIEMLPGGDESRRRVIGLIKIANHGEVRLDGTSDYGVVLTKTPPFSGALKERWRKAKFEDDDEAIVGEVVGFHRTKRGVYDLLYRALEACGLAKRDLAGRHGR